MEWSQEISSFLKQLIEQLQPLYEKAEARAIVHYWADERIKIPKHRRFMDEGILIDELAFAAYQKEAHELIAGKPVQYVTGKAYFYGEAFDVNEAVLIPRPETEELVAWILETIQPIPSPLKGLDIGTGSGCIPIMLQKEGRLQLVMTGFDVSEKALKVASQNARQLDSPVTFLQQDILQSQPEDYGDWNFIVSNPPYVLEQEAESLHPNVVEHEPHLALFTPDDDPILFYRVIGELGKTWLKADGLLFFEIHRDHGGAIKNMLEEMGYRNVTLKNDLRGNPRMIRANR